MLGVGVGFRVLLALPCLGFGALSQGDSVMLGVAECCGSARMVLVLGPTGG
jgi:hypothetical protein